jgi:hypothetical protein
LLIAGIIILVLGVVMIGGGVVGVRGTTTTIKTFSQQQTGEYVSGEIILNSSSVVVVRSPVSAGGLIPAQDLSAVNSANIGSYAVSARSTAGGSATYISLTGDYYYVVFSSSQPTSTSVTVAGSLGRTVISGLLVVLGFIVFLVGVILAIVGAIRGRRSSRRAKEQKSVSDADYYASRQGGAQQPPPPTSSPSQ